MRRVSILGATGSIGQNTLDVLSTFPQGTFEIQALTGGRNVAALAAAARTTGAKRVVTAFPDCYQALAERCSDLDVFVAAGQDALIEAASMPTDWTMSAIVGIAGLEPSLCALRHTKTLALANKESLVTAGPLLLQQAADAGTKILPVDSEHSAIFQALNGEDLAAVERVIITASGGAFRDWPIEKLSSATPDQAATHPNWAMGQRITIDSASMFNKAMELIETHAFFGFDPNRIETLIHPQSLVHALVGFNDGGFIAHVGPPDMRHAIGYALNWPNRQDLPVERLDFGAIGRLDFQHPDPVRYPALELAQTVMSEGGLSGAVFTAAKEAALDAFIAEDLRFTDMSVVVSQVLDRHIHKSDGSDTNLTLEKIQSADKVARTLAAEAIAGLKERQG